MIYDDAYIYIYGYQISYGIHISYIRYHISTTIYHLCIYGITPEKTSRWLWLGLGRILTTNREFPWALIHAAYRLYSMGIQVPKNIGLIYMVGTSNKLVPEMASDI